MLGYLKDITKHTFGLGIIDLIKITGDKTTTEIEAMAADRSVIIKAKTHAAVAEFAGQFGMPNLGKLNTLLNLPEYKEKAKITVVTRKGSNGEDVLAGLHFENETKDFKNDYRFMTSDMINESLKTIKFKGVKWNVEVVPSLPNIQRMRSMTSANAEETTFMAKTENGSLKFFFGDHSSHAGDFVFADNVQGTLAKGYLWPISVVNSILSLPGDKMFRFSDEGAAQITVDSGLARYDFIIPAQQK